MATTTPAATASAVRSAPSWLRAVARRWPTLLAVAMAAVSWGADTVMASHVLPLLPLLYVIMAILRRRGLSWPILGACLVLFGLMSVQPFVDPAIGIFGIAAATVLAGLIGRRGSDDQTEVLAQAGGLIIFGTLAVVSLAVAPDVARYLLVTGWLGHGVWDLVHLRRDAVVSRSYAEWCGVVDLLMAVQLLLLV